MNGSVDVVLKLSSGQRDFIQVMLETVQRLGQVNVGKRDGCLALCVAMLERVNIVSSSTTSFALMISGLTLIYSRTSTTVI